MKTATVSEPEPPFAELLVKSVNDVGVAVNVWVLDGFDMVVAPSTSTWTQFVVSMKLAPATVNVPDPVNWTGTLVASSRQLPLKTTVYATAICEQLLL